MNELDKATISEMENLCDKAIDLKKIIADHEEKIETIREELRPLERKIQEYLEHFGKKNWAARGGDISLRERTSVKIPRTEADKRLLFSFFKERGVEWEMFGVNSAALNSFYSSEKEACAQENRPCVVPGIGPEEIFTTVILKPKKG